MASYIVLVSLYSEVSIFKVDNFCLILFFKVINFLTTVGNRAFGFCSNIVLLISIDSYKVSFLTGDKSILAGSRQKSIIALG